MAAFQMQARSSTSGALVTWSSVAADFAAASYPGPGTALDVAVSMRPAAAGGGAGTTDHGLLTGLADDDHAQYELARRPQTTAYTGASNDAALADARACTITTRATAISLRLRLQASIAWVADTLLGGINTGAGTLTITAEGGVTLNGSVTVPQNGWWWAKRTALNTWQVFTGGSAGVSDHGALTGLTDDDHTQYLLSSGARALSGDLDAGGNQLTNLGAGSASTDALQKSQIEALIAAAALGASGGGGDGFAFTFDTATGDADPTAGKLRFNNATLASVTSLYVDLADFSANDITAWLDRLDDSVGTIKGYVRVGSKTSLTKWALFSLSAVVSATGYRKLTVAHVASGGGGLPNTSAGDTFLSFESLGIIGTLPVSSGGTGLTSVGAAGLVPTSNGAGALVMAAPNAAGVGGDGFRFTYSTTTADADPGAGTFRGNNATLSSVTALFVDLAEFGATDVTAWLDSLDDQGSAILGRIRLQSISDATKWIVYNLTAWTTATGYRKLTVTYVAGPGGLTTTAGDTFLSFDRGMGSGDFGAANYGSTGYSYVGSGTKATVGTGYRYPAAVTAYFKGTSGDLRFWGIGDDGTDFVNFGDTTYGIEWSEIASGRIVLALCVGGKLTTTMMPAGTGSRVAYHAQCATEPSSGAPGADGVITWANAGSLRSKSPLHPTNGSWDLVPNTSFSRYYPPEQGAETSATTANQVVQTIDTSVLPAECSGIIRTVLTCADTSSFGAQEIMVGFCRRAGALQSGAAGTPSGTVSQGSASFGYSGDNIQVRITPADAVNYRWTAHTTMTFSSHTNAE
jgi:hypothetical protein